MPKKLLIGLLIDSYQIPHWSYRMVKKIIDGDYAEVVLVVEKTASGCLVGKTDQPGGAAIDAMIFSSLCKLDKAMYPLETDALEPKDLQGLLPKTVQNIIVEPIPNDLLESFSESDCKKILSFKLDVMVKLGFGDLCGAVFSCARYGVWLCHHGDNRVNQGDPAGFWEVVEGRGETGSVLEMRTDDSEGMKILYRSFSQTNGRSVCQNSNVDYWKMGCFIPRKLKELHVCGEEAFFSGMRAENQHPFFYSRRLYSIPRQFEWIKLALRHFYKMIDSNIQRWFYFDQYILLYGINKGKTFSQTVARYRKLVPPDDRFWADPFIVYENRQYYIFIEEVPAKTNKGHISFLTIDENENVSIPRKIIEKPYHMSYPFIFSYNDEYYMIPETGANKTIDLYKCVCFPDQWEMMTTLMDNVCAFDSTLLQKDGKWWLFTTIRESEESASIDELFLFYSADLFSGNWTPHVKNPVVSDVRSARPAGKIFSHNGNWYRPAQNSSKIYGYGIKINHIVTLTEEEYKEECVNDIEPLWDKKIKAVHTLNFVNELTIIDGLLKKSRYPGAIVRHLHKAFRSIF